MQKIASGPVLILLIALAVGIAFHFAHPTEAGLYAAFALAGLVVYLGIAAVLNLFRKAAQDRAGDAPG